MDDSRLTWLPRWAKRLFWLVGFPCWLGFAALIITMKLFEYQALLFVFFGGFFVSGAVGTFYAVRALSRGEL